MPFILVNNKPFEEIEFDNEAELESAIVQNQKHIFGPDTIYIDYKRKIGKNNSENKGVPDALLIDFSNRKKPRLFFIENEIAEHNLYEHIGPQIIRFYSAIDTIESKRMLYKKILEILNANTTLREGINNELKKTNFENTEALLNYLIYEGTIKIIIIIDEITPDLDALLNRLKEKPEVLLIKKYVFEDKIIYYYIPLEEGLVKTEEPNGSRESFEIDTIVCPAREEGFKYAFLENNAWWAIRISPSLIQKIKYIAIYQTKPISSIKWIADVKSIEPYKDTGKYILSLDKKREIKPIKMAEGESNLAPQSPRYTNIKRLMNSTSLKEIW